MAENITVNEEIKEENTTKKKEIFTFIKPGFYTNAQSSEVRLVTNTPPTDDHRKVQVIIFDEQKLKPEVSAEIIKDRGWSIEQWQQFIKSTEHHIESIYKKLAGDAKNTIQFDGWKILKSNKYYPLVKCAKTEAFFRANGSPVVVCREYENKLIKELKEELKNLKEEGDVEGVNIYDLWKKVTNYKNKVVRLKEKNHISANPYRNFRKEIQDIYNKAAPKRDLQKKEQKEKTEEYKKNLSELLEEAGKIKEISHATEEVSPEALTMLKTIRQKIKDLQTQNSISFKELKSIFSAISPISEHENEKMKKALEAKKETFTKWRNNANTLRKKIQDLKFADITEVNLSELSDTVNKAQENNEIGDKEKQSLLELIAAKSKQIESAKKQREIELKQKEKLLKQIEVASLKEIKDQYSKVNIGFSYDPEAHEILQKLATVLDSLEPQNKTQRDEIDSVRKLIKGKIKTLESLKAICDK